MPAGNLSPQDALDLIRETWISNAAYLKDFEERLKAPAPLLPFVGAGLSKPMGFPLWGDFLRDMAKECGRTGEIESLLSAGKYEAAATAAEEGMGATIFNQRVTHAYGERKSEEVALCGPALVLPALTHGAVVTTNFDRVLERVFKEVGKPFHHFVIGAQVDFIEKAVSGDKAFLLKIHGDGEERTGRVLTRAEYEKHYGGKKATGLRAQLTRILHGRTLLFVGCSLNQDRTMDVLLEALKQSPGMHHFAIVEKPAADPEFYVKQKHLGDRGISPIWFPKGRYDVVEPLLRWAASQRNPNHSPGSEPGSEPVDSGFPKWIGGRYVDRPDVEREVAPLFQNPAGGKATRLVALHAHGGMGKTRLASHEALERKEAFPDGVFFVDLTNVSPTAEAFIEAISRRLGLLATAKTQDELIEELKHKHLLLVLDNYDRIENNGPVGKFCKRLLEETDAVSILMTGRKVERIGQRVPVEKMLHGEAMDLFISRARLRIPGWQVNHKRDLDHVLHLCAYIPRAIELAAAWGGPPVAEGYR